MVNRSCQVCHPYPEEELRQRVYAIQDRTRAMMDRAGKALSDMMASIVAAKSAGANEQQLKPVIDLQRKGQWRLDYIYAENSMGFHADQETARVLGESIDYLRQAQGAADALRLAPVKSATTREAEAPQGVMPPGKSPPGR
jgi:nitrite reductase (cytochrome c-552)